jgi:hypothetical protein
MTYSKIRPLTLGTDMGRSQTDFYATVAALSLFSDILGHPRSPQSMTGIQHLNTTINILRDKLRSRPSVGDLEQMYDTIDMVSELTRLGKCAIAKGVTELGQNEK